MKIERTYFICEHCGLMVGVIDDSGVTPVCCGEEMTLLQANTVDASQEKHVPVLTREGNVLNVAVGSVPHPMTKEHHIAWIAVAQDGHTQRLTLPDDGEAKAIVHINPGPATVYAYCNLHGLWSAEMS